VGFLRRENHALADDLLRLHGGAGLTS
jgi:hypothetical protein